MRAIDADKLIEFIENRYDITWKNVIFTNDYEGGIKDACVDILEEINKMPTIEPQCKKGQWIYNSPVTMKCNQCGFVIKDWDWYRSKHCPNCGARMEEGEAE